MVDQTATPTTRRDKALNAVRGLYEAYNAHDLDAVLAWWVPENGVEHLPLVGDLAVPGPLRTHLAGFYEAFPDARTEIINIVADESGRVAAQVRLAGTFTGTSFNGLRANGRAWVARMAEFFVVDEAGLITHMDAYMDNMDLARQLDLLPPEGGAAEKVMRLAFNTKVALQSRFLRRR